MRQPDIEIYLKDTNQETVSQWLAQVLGQCSPWQQRGLTFKCQAGDIPVTWVPKAVGRWSSLLLESDQTPWVDDLSCAKDAFTALGCQVRCAVGGWQEDEAVDAEVDLWLKVDAEGVSEITWRTE